MWWSWTLAAIGVTGLYLTTRRNWRGYLLGVAVQVLWIAYAIVTRQWGFIVSALVYGAVNMIGLVSWRRAEMAKRPAAVEALNRVDWSGRDHAQTNPGHTVMTTIHQPWVCQDCPAKSPAWELVSKPVKTKRAGN